MAFRIPSASELQPSFTFLKKILFSSSYVENYTHSNKKIADAIRQVKHKKHNICDTRENKSSEDVVHYVSPWRVVFEVIFHKFSIEQKRTTEIKFFFGGDKKLFMELENVVLL